VGLLTSAIRKGGCSSVKKEGGKDPKSGIVRSAKGIQTFLLQRLLYNIQAGRKKREGEKNFTVPGMDAEIVGGRRKSELRGLSFCDLATVLSKKAIKVHGEKKSSIFLV